MKTVAVLYWPRGPHYTTQVFTTNVNGWSVNDSVVLDVEAVTATSRDQLIMYVQMSPFIEQRKDPGNRRLSGKKAAIKSLNPETRSLKPVEDGVAMDLDEEDQELPPGGVPMDMDEEGESIQYPKVRTPISSPRTRKIRKTIDLERDISTPTPKVIRSPSIQQTPSRNSTMDLAAAIGQLPVQVAFNETSSEDQIPPHVPGGESDVESTLCLLRRPSRECADNNEAPVNNAEHSPAVRVDDRASTDRTQSLTEGEGDGDNKRARSEQPPSSYPRPKQKSEKARRLPEGQSWIDAKHPFIAQDHEAIVEIAEAWLEEQHKVSVQYNYRRGQKRIAVRALLQRDARGILEVVLQVEHKAQRSFNFPEEGVQYESLRREKETGQPPPKLAATTPTQPGM